ncbi:hypothetical protein YC2023_039902 [Brassica napus]
MNVLTIAGSVPSYVWTIKNRPIFWLKLLGSSQSVYHSVCIPSNNSLSMTEEERNDLNSCILNQKLAWRSKEHERYVTYTRDIVPSFVPVNKPVAGSNLVQKRDKESCTHVHQLCFYVTGGKISLLGEKMPWTFHNSFSMLNK